LLPKVARLGELLGGLAERHPNVHEVRQCGLISGIELRQPDGEPFPAERRMGTAVCVAVRDHGLLTRPIRDTIVLMPPLCVTEEEIAMAVAAIGAAVDDVAQIG